MAQIQTGLFVSGRDWCDYLSYSGGMPMWRKRVEPIPEWTTAILAVVTSFEVASAELIETYHARVEGLPTTERIIYEEFVI